MGDNKYAIGLDYGTNSARALIVNIETGGEIITASQEYPGGENGIYYSEDNPLLARQYPGDYVTVLERILTKIVQRAKSRQIKPDEIYGIGVASTASTPLPINHDVKPLALNSKFSDNYNAYAWLWKDHTSTEEARQITELARKIRPEYLKRCGGTYSSEWFFSKIYHCLKVDPEVFDNAYTWLELSDFIPAILADINDADKIKRNVCAAGHKAMYAEDWGGLPDREFWESLDDRMAKISDFMYENAYGVDEPAGYLSKKWASKTGLKKGIPIAMGIIDAHAGAIGTGVGEKTMVKIIGTSTCDIMVEPPDNVEESIPGTTGMVYGSVLPEYVGIEAGQPAVGDLFNWYISEILGESEKAHQQLSQKAKQQATGESGLLALDWNNGNRSILGDQNLSGLIIGQTLNTKNHEIYRALIESTAFGSLSIIERMEEYGISIDKVISCGGITNKNPFFMQLYADILNREIKVSAISETVALGAAIIGGFHAFIMDGEKTSIQRLQQTICTLQDRSFQPRSSERKTYKELYSLYKTLHDAFGGVEASPSNIGHIMKRLKAIQQKAINANN